MSPEPDDADGDLQNLYVLMQPTRYKIVKLLRDSPKPMYVKEIAQAIGADERITSFHLATLAENGFVDGEYRTIELPKARSAPMSRAAKFYQLTPKVAQVERRLGKPI